MPFRLCVRLMVVSSGSKCILSKLDHYSKHAAGETRFVNKSLEIWLVRIF